MLLVEDDPGDAFLVSELLREEAAPIDVRRAQSLTEGLDLLRSDPFDCVLLDLGLPDASGLVALERLREAAPQVAHLVLAGDRDDQRGIAFAVDGAKRMQALINDLLAFSRVGRVERPRELVDIEELVEQATSVLALAIEETGATVEVRGDLPAVYGERTLLGLVLQNLISKAIKFHADEPPVVRVSARRDGEHFEFAVADNGIGIDPEYADRIFVIFQRLHARDVYAGTGIGLTMCRKVIEYHGGEIWLEASQNGAGSTFRFTLPVPDIATEEATP